MSVTYRERDDWVEIESRPQDGSPRRMRRFRFDSPDCLQAIQCFLSLCGEEPHKWLSRNPGLMNRFVDRSFNPKEKTVKTKEVQTIDELAKSMRDMADTLTRSLVIPMKPEEVTMQSALQRLRAVLPNEYISIEFNLHCHSRKGNGDDINCEYSVYDGKNHHKGGTLSEAVNKVLVALAAEQVEQPEDPVAEGQKMMDQLSPVGDPAPF
jgi:hypothetical protein